MISLFSFIGNTLYLILILIALYCLFHALGTFLVLWMETQLTHWRDEKQPKPQALTVLRAMVYEFGCNYLRCLLIPFAGLYAKPNALNVADQAPILLVHGYGQYQSYWYWFQYQLKNWGFSPVYTLNPWETSNRIESHAQVLAKKIQVIKAKHPDQKITLIGHSMGGLVSAYYGEYLASTQEINKIITMGTPFYGTRLAGLGFGQSAQEMAPDSPFLSQLRQRIQTSSTPYYCLASQVDNLIVPWQSALLNNDPSHEKIFPDLGHLRFLVNSDVLETVKGWLEAP